MDVLAGRGLSCHLLFYAAIDAIGGAICFVWATRGWGGRDGRREGWVEGVRDGWREGRREAEECS